MIHSVNSRIVSGATARGIGPMPPTTRRRRVVVAIPGGAEPLATVARERGGSLIHAIAHTLRWEKTARGSGGTIVEQREALLSVTASQGLLRFCVRTVVQRTMPEETAIVLCLIADCLAPSEPQSTQRP